MSIQSHDKRRFLLKQALASSVIAAFGYGSVYRKKPAVPQSEKTPFRAKLAEMLKAMAVDYHGDVSEETHCANIKWMADTLTKGFSKSGILLENRVRIGIAQKALNLYLKYLWCLDEIKGPPPHCPLDRRIIGRIKKRLPLGLKDARWTQLDNIKDYKIIMDACRKEAQAEGKSTAEWELETWPKG